MSCADNIKLSHQKSLIDYFCKKLNKEYAKRKSFTVHL